MRRRSAGVLTFTQPRRLETNRVQGRGQARAPLPEPLGLLTIQPQLTVGSISAQAKVFAWTKLQPGGNSVKLYVKDIVGAGKVQFMLGGKEVAWVRAQDESDPKLYFANGFSYLVRTVDLAPGKNRFEILVDGERVFRATYFRKS